MNSMPPIVGVPILTLMVTGLFHADELADLEMTQHTKQGIPQMTVITKESIAKTQYKGSVFGHERTSSELVMRSMRSPCEPLISTTSFWREVGLQPLHERFQLHRIPE